MVLGPYASFCLLFLSTLLNGRTGLYSVGKYHPEECADQANEPCVSQLLDFTGIPLGQILLKVANRPGDLG